MFRTVLVPLDGSPLAERALPFALTLARRTRGRVVLVRCTLAHSTPFRASSAEQVAAISAAEAYLGRLAGGARVAPGPPGSPAEPEGRDGELEFGVYYGPAAEGILEEARLRHADAIVMATHGRSEPGRWLFGSVADEVVRHAEVPVLLVPAAAAAVRCCWSSDDRLRVLVPLDGSASAESILEVIRPLARATPISALLLRVVEPQLAYPAVPDFGLVPVIDQTVAVEAASRYLERVADSLRDCGAAVAVYATTGYPAVAIAALAGKGHFDLIAMTTHGRTGLARAVLGSVATGVIQVAGVPLLLERPTGLWHTAATETAQRAPAR